MSLRLPKEGLILCVARIYRIQILNSWPDDSTGWSTGPDGDVACHPHKRQVFLGASRETACEVQVGFHELVHCIVQPPNFSIDAVSECRWLLQFEEALAHALATPPEQKRILEWQLDLTPAGEWRTLRQTPGYHRLPFYLKGLKDLIQMGALLKNGQPSYKYPDWSVLEKVEHANIA